MIGTSILLLIATNKLQQLMSQVVITDDSEGEYINQLGWTAGYLLCIFNLLCLIQMFLDYVFHFMNYFAQKRRAEAERLA